MKNFLFGLVEVCLIGFTISSCNQSKNAYLDKQIALAEKYGVVIEEYPGKAIFPVGYFQAILKPGTPIDQVHKLIKDYEIVYHCDDIGELYYYFSSEDNLALRFIILYDDDLRFAKIITEDENSRSLEPNKCGPEGLLKP